MSVLSSIAALKTKWNTFIKKNFQQLITGEVLNGLGNDIIDTFSSEYTKGLNLKVDKTAIGLTNGGINLPAGQAYKINGVDILALIVSNGGGFVTSFDASTGTFPSTGTGANNAIKGGDFWRISKAGTINGLMPTSNCAVFDIIMATRDGANDPADFLHIPGNTDLSAILTRIAGLETKMETIEEGATADQTPAEIITAIESVTQESDKLNALALSNVEASKHTNAAYPELDTIQKALLNANNNKVDVVNGKHLSTNDFTNGYKSKLDQLNEHYRGSYPSLALLRQSIPYGNPGDEALIDAGVLSEAKKAIWDPSDAQWIIASGGTITIDANPTEGSLNAVSSGGAFNALANKVDKVNGKQLSTEDYTTAEKNKLAGISNHYRGTYTTLAALQAAIPTGNPGDEALVDAGAGHNAQKYIWDEQEGWIVGSGTGASSFAELSGNPGDNAALASALAGKQANLGFTPVNSATIDITLNFVQLQTYNLVYPQNWKITAVTTNSGGVTATINLGGTSTAYTLGNQVNAWNGLDISVNAIGKVHLIGTLL